MIVILCVCVYLRVCLALHVASLSGHVSTVRLLLEKGAMVDSLDVMKHTPLFRACEMGQRDVILTLIKGAQARLGMFMHYSPCGFVLWVCTCLMGTCASCGTS